jgi:hypothetical protein
MDVARLEAVTRSRILHGERSKALEHRRRSEVVKLSV